MNESNICAGGAVTEQELAAIAQYSRRPLTAEEVYTFPLVLCDNDLDRDNECFTDEALEKLAELFCGKTGIFDHDPRGEKQTARIYRCRVEPEEGRLNYRGDPYKALKADAYMVRTAANADLILEIDGGIKKEVSVGCAVQKNICSICGADRREEPCGHQPGKRYGGKLCCTLLAEPSDAYEWSFVAVPAQPAAGVTKSHAVRRALHLTPERAIAEMERASCIWTPLLPPDCGSILRCWSAKVRTPTATGRHCVKRSAAGRCWHSRSFPLRCWKKAWRH